MAGGASSAELRSARNLLSRKIDADHDPCPDRSRCTGHAAQAARTDPSAWVTAADYPAAALRADEQGIVSFRLDVSPEGRVTGCTITASSGSSVLDSTTCRLMVRRARFDPAKDESGRAVPSTFQSRLRWALPPKPPPGPPAPGMVVTKFDLTPDGRVERCSAEARGKAPPAAAQSSCTRAEAQSGSAFLKQQGAAYRTVRIVNSISLDDEKFPIDGTGWGRLLQRQSGEILLDAAWKPIRCTTLASVGPAAGAGLCSTLRPPLQPGETPAAQPAHRVVVDMAVFGIPR